MPDQKLTLRTADSQDVDSVFRILNTSRLEYLPYAKSPHSNEGIRGWVSGHLIPSGGVVIAELAGEDVGVLSTSVDDGIGWIDQLYLAPGFVNQGIGSELLTHALNELSRPVRLYTFQQNEQAIRFYKRHGFSAIEYTDGEGNEEKCPDVLLELVSL